MLSEDGVVASEGKGPTDNQRPTHRGDEQEYRGRGKVMATLISGVLFRVVVSSERSSSVLIDFSTKKYSSLQKISDFSHQQRL